MKAYLYHPVLKPRQIMGYCENTIYAIDFVAKNACDLCSLVQHSEQDIPMTNFVQKIVCHQAKANKTLLIEHYT